MSRSFWCFISYRHSDNSIKGREWATWLHRELETFEVPEELVGQENELGAVIPERIYPVFRDEEELPAYADLSSAIVHALRQSRSLVVICSPDAKASKFVNEEVALFKGLGRSDRVCGMVIRGASVAPAGSDCLPLPLVRKVSPGGAVTQVAESPLLVDLRAPDGTEEWHDDELRQAALTDAGASVEQADAESATRGAKLLEARLFLVAWVLGISYQRLSDAYEKRERSLRRGRYLTYAFWASLALAVGLAAWFGVQAAAGMKRQANESSGRAEMATQTAAKAQQEIAAKAEEGAKVRLGTLYAEAVGLRQTKRWQEAGIIFKQASDAGHLPSRVEYARMLAEGKGMAADLVRAIRLLEGAADVGDLGARALLGRLLLAQDADAVARARGVELLRQCLRDGDRTVRLELAKALVVGNPAEAMVLLKEDALDGVPEASWMLGGLLKERGGSAPPVGQIPEWYRWWLKAADAGWMPAKRDAGFALWDGSMGPPASFGPADRRAALGRLLEAANAGDKEAPQRLVSLFGNQANHPSDPTELQEFLLEGAKAGVPKAMFDLAEHLADKAKSPDDPNFIPALDWYARSGRAGMRPASELRAATLIQRLAGAGNDAERRLKLSNALGLYVAAANAGSVEGMVGAAEVSQLLEAPDSMAKSEGWLRTAETRGSRKGRRLLASLIIKQGKDVREAAALLRKGIELGDGEAALMLGDWMLPHALGREQLALTFEAYMQGANIGNALCALRAAAMLRRGQGVPADQVRAEQLEIKAAESGDPFCMMERGRVLLASGDEDKLPEAHAWLSLAAATGRTKECEPLLARASALLGEARRKVASEVREKLLKRIRPAVSAEGR